MRVKLVVSEESHCGEGVLFIKKKSGNSSSASETFSYASLHPYSGFVANFEVFGKMYGEKDALHEINKELFLKKMKEWGSRGRRTAERRMLNKKYCLDIRK